jgi:predicted nuclease of predicted toxin-antitoxin system
VAKLRVLLDEDIADELKDAFPRKIQVYTVAGLGMSGAEDIAVVEEAVSKKCLIVTANKDFLPVYKNHDWRRGRDRRYFWGLIFLKNSNAISKLEQLRRAIKEIDYQFDDILTVSSTGLVTRERLDGRDTLPNHSK